MTVLEFFNALKLHPSLETKLSRWLMLDAFHKQKGARAFQTLNTVSISFESKVAADEYFRLLKAGMRT